MDCSPPDSSVHGIFQARILVWVAISFSRGSFPPWDRAHRLLHLLYWQVGSLPLSLLGSPCHLVIHINTQENDQDCHHCCWNDENVVNKWKECDEESVIGKSKLKNEFPGQVGKEECSIQKWVVQGPVCGRREHEMRPVWIEGERGGEQRVRLEKKAGTKLCQPNHANNCTF